MSREQEKVFKCFARGKILINKHFESSQKLRKDDIGIWENFIRNMLSNYMLCNGTGILYMLGLL